MSKLVAIDAMVFVWGIKKEATVGQEDMIEKTRILFERLDKDGIQLLIPAPVLAEVLAPIDDNRRKEVLKVVENTANVYPFDSFCAEVFAEMMYNYKNAVNQEELRRYRTEHLVPKDKMKFDYMISAIAVSNNALCIFSNDHGLSVFASPSIDVVKISDSISIPKLNLGNQLGMTFGT